jgi:hypothetical protein
MNNFRPARSIWMLAATAVLAGFSHADAPDGYAAEVVEKDPPAEIADEIKAEVSNQAVQVTGPDGVRYVFWFAKSIALESAGDDPLAGIPEITLLGVVQAQEDVENLDFREDEVLPGAYTMRFGLQPEDGNHLGTSPYPYFAILIPAERDQKLGGIEDHDDMVDRSMEDTAGIHPYILAMQPLPADAPEETLSVGAGEHDWKFVVVELPGSVDGEAAPFKIALVFEGVGEL